MNTLCKICTVCLSLLLFASCAEPTAPLKVLQLNTWFECSKVENGTQALADIIQDTDPEVVFLCEVWHEPFLTELLDSLQARGIQYYGAHEDISALILSKYPLEGVHSTFSKEKWGAKANIECADQPIALYSLHLDWKHYECYMPRGYSGATWKKIEAPATDADSVLAANRISKRDEEIAAFIKDAQRERDQGSLVILGGDFNEPSHLDWQEDTKDLRNHNGLVVNWDCSYMLQQAGYRDAYREIYPNAVTHPAFTYPAGNKYVAPKELLWTECVDDRDRIDFIYYYPEDNISLKSIQLVGPVEDFYKGKVTVVEHTKDSILTPSGIWPTDHKGNLAVFEIKNR